MPDKEPSGPTLIQHPVGALLLILSVSIVCCLSLLGALIKAWLAG